MFSSEPRCNSYPSSSPPRMKKHTFRNLALGFTGAMFVTAFALQPTINCQCQVFKHLIGY
ncbi:hypothetical protein BT96DRAFT_710926 [Gymnopus androsaceus JB14]|uniref:Uncharacterized protein n=1 Tax=Gymnopus androsaceus JB14 TaxID=1447944 RepID=A0A6A4HPX8_9AGAR|nr:hypothetical protein BT96DRAFT_710926 [Gymnopus androsaceus JB14]